MTIDPGQLAIAMGLAAVLVVIIIVLADRYFWYNKMMAKKESQPSEAEETYDVSKHFILIGILKDDKGHTSLSTLQFLLWTLLISILYITLWILQFMDGIPDAPQAIPENLIPLMGISVAVPLASKGIMEYKKEKPRQEGVTYKEPGYSPLLGEKGNPSLLRFQMFLWTIVAIGIYFWQFKITAGLPDTVPGTFMLPPIDPTLLFLMGLSQTGYLGSKAYAGTLEKTKTTQIKSSGTSRVTEQRLSGASLLISETIPNIIRPGEILTIVGSGFGSNKGTMMINQKRVEEKDILRWNQTRIECKLPDINPGEYPLKLIVDGSTDETRINVTGSEWRAKGTDVVPAEIISEIWIDDPGNKGYKKPPIGHFIKDKRYYFFFEFAVPPGTGSWNTKFKADFSIKKENGEYEKKPTKGEFLPGHINGNNYGVFDHKFENEEGYYYIEIHGMKSKTMRIHVGELPEERKE